MKVFCSNCQTSVCHNMPKVGKSVLDPSGVIKEFGGPGIWEHDPKRKIFFCKLCSVSCDQARRSLIRQHVDSNKHKKNLQLSNDGKLAKQQTLVLAGPSQGGTSVFAKDLCKAFVACNIPLYKVEHPALIQLFEKHGKVAMPSRRTLTRILETESKDLMETIKNKLIGQDLFVAVDETTDCKGRAMCAILVGPLDGTFLKRPYLIDLADIKTTNNQTVQQFVTSALFKLLGDNLDYQKVLMFVTDAAAYCLKAGRGLKTLFPNLIHVTCVCHGLNRVAEKVRYSYPKVDKMVAEIKKIFVKSPRRCHEFTTACQIPLPPLPVLTR